MLITATGAAGRSATTLVDVTVKRQAKKKKPRHALIAWLALAPLTPGGAVAG